MNVPTTRGDIGRIPAQRETGVDPVESERATAAERGLIARLQRILDSDRLSGPELARQARTLGLFALFVVIALMPVLREVGWPQNHEQGRMFARTAIYAQHMRHGDFMPVWSDGDTFGFGSPLPVFYHRLFFWISGGLVLIGWPVKAAVLGALTALMLVGMYGMRCSLLRLNSSATPANLGAIALVLAPYTFTDWFTRGEVGEFAAMMFVPWILWWALAVVERNHAGMSLVPIMLMTYLSHSVIAFYGLIMTGGAYLIALTCNPGRLALTRRYVTVIGLTALPLGAFFVLTRAFAPDYDISQIVPDRMLPKYNRHPLREFFWDNKFHWNSPGFLDMTVNVGTALWIALAAALVWRVVAVGRGSRAFFVDKREVFLASVVIVFMAMQTKSFEDVYNLPYFKYIQFPWRLNSFITPALILLVLGVAGRTAQRLGTQRLLVPACVGLVAALALASPIRILKPSVINVADYRASHIENADGSSLGNQLVMLGEFLPVVHDGARKLTVDQVYAAYAKLATMGSRLQVLRGNCQVTEPRRTFEAASRTFDLSCTGPGEIALPISYNELSTVRLNGVSLPYHRLDGDPRIAVDVPAATGRLTVELPTLRRTLARLIP